MEKLAKNREDQAMTQGLAELGIEDDIEALIPFDYLTPSQVARRMGRVVPIVKDLILQQDEQLDFDVRANAIVAQTDLSKSDVIAAIWRLMSEEILQPVNGHLILQANGRP
ncbi:MAG: hypothetical protein LBK28_07185 [Propionibacteriaceae bacterium]|jgi:hypothetical protein|nr:hypothetical protein [Propionibacteriaceae bacterium]